MNAKVKQQPGRGYVYIAGAGPGDPELLTVKAERVLRDADVILYDDLVSLELVDQYNAVKIYTGKRKNSHHFEQEEINREIVRHALAGKKVVRLKGGDPFVFGRGGEEIDTLRAHDIGYEIVPGITAAHGASAYSEIPLTMRGISSSVAFCTGHPVGNIHVPDTDTIVYYMVASTVHDVLDAVAAKGRSGSTMVAVVQNATRYNQKIFTGTIDDFRTREKTVYSPALLIVGDSIGKFIEHNWYSRKKKVLLTGGDSSRYSPTGCITVHFACRKISGADLQAVEQAFGRIGDFSLLFFPNRFSVKYFFRFLFESGRDVRSLAHMTICSAGSAAADELRKAGLVPDHHLEPDAAGGYAGSFRERGITGSHILLPGSNSVDDTLVERLKGLGNEVTPLGVYAHEVRQDEAIDLDFIDEIYFSSPACVRNFHSLFTSIPERITVTPADLATEEAFRRLFGH
ncbi:uroporphyrinogen-III C-methyltransferase [Prosthecochloris sp. GSB1]|uniref:uroporphyrinogen-III C-methyltransferase n=1 Tax=Prosthecochloris sp. GSB1 TaxID=281093 RepID=UPI000B8CA140|nr:uroporphyrinogen-III C-methyltransferase [Prosthecochloris sp. GSB1]ASQ89572.1 uroporphyrinogen-III C-methyltransferase [Prosthecochloris sp. GSB1]